MKKIITVVTVLFAFTLTANAQESKKMLEKKSAVKEVVTPTKSVTSADAAKKDATLITEYLGLNNTQNENFLNLFQMKHELMQDASMTMERKKEMSRIVGLKIEASIDADQFAKLKENKDLYKQLLSQDLLK